MNTKLLMALSALVGFAALADEVPVQMQMQLMTKAAAFDRNLASRGGDPMTVLVVFAAGAESEGRVAVELINEIGSIGSRRVAAVSVPYSSGSALKEQVLRDKPGVVYLAARLSEKEIADISNEMAGLDVLTCGGSSAHVNGGVVLGFALTEGRPKMLVRLAQAKKQNVEFQGKLLKMVQLVE